MMIFAKDMIKSHPLDTVPKEILLNPRFEPYFKDCIGAIDGTLVHAIIQPEKQIPYRGRKGECMQQVMAVCSFDMLFTYVVCGWEGTAHDQRILLDAISDDRLKFPHAPPGKYYLVDAGYTNMRGFLSPFRNVRYWLPDFQGVAVPRTREEHFNRLHSSLRNVIEQSFGVLKARFPILKRMAPYPFPVQRSIVVAAMAMHNFIRKEDMEDRLFSQFSEDDAQVERDTDVEESHGENAYTFDITDRTEMDAKRNLIADAIWRDASSDV
eukprot:TRINITY_DN2442_c0_g2_i1.p1 TRINITY_DN2442_c0_g2~~TRINITY_DN2442_c0_g2_i1.p1  ORF type:complete len:267 (-),score=43.65 TRINITY_DN2442_c0_g2_i1:1151-1951(-)